MGYTGIRVHVYAYNAKTFRQDRKIQQIYEKKIHVVLPKAPISLANKTLDTLFSDFPKTGFNYICLCNGRLSLINITSGNAIFSCGSTMV